MDEIAVTYGGDIMFKFPYTSFEKINLDWIMRTLNQLKDAIPLVQQATTIYNQALEALADANEAVETVTDQAAAAVSTANAASTAANAAQLSAELATTTANNASTTAGEASTTAGEASTTATAADTKATAALAKAGWNYRGWIYSATGQTSKTENVQDCTELMLEIIKADLYDCTTSSVIIPLEILSGSYQGIPDVSTYGVCVDVFGSTVRITKNNNNITVIFATTPQGLMAYVHLYVR